MSGAQERKLRPKPSVAFVSEENARQNIQIKLQYLLELLNSNKELSHFDRGVILKSLPTSHRGFNGWVSDQVDALPWRKIESFHSNSRIALHRSGLLDRVDKALASVVAARNAAISTDKKAETLAGLNRQLKVEAQLRKIGEIEVVRLKRQIKDLVDTCDDLRMQLEAANREASMLSASIAGAREPGKGRVVRLTAVSTKVKERGK